ncbi:MAG: twin-arginine translocase TatA/TatE family subunit [Phycisphaerae bacterium]|nr:twin-arginine translocase TatA/TatE family subunit [Phycisphaerae bacterium]
MASTLNCLALGMPGGTDLIIIAFIGLLLFGKRLPEVGKSLGKGIVEFKKGIQGIEDDIQNATTTNRQNMNNQKDMLPPPENRNYDPGTRNTEQPVSQQQQQQQQ